MQQNQESTKIAGFLAATAPLIAGQVRMVLKSQGYQVREEGTGLDLTFSISAGKAEVKFFLHNLFLEIAAVDRDEEPLRFDRRLKDFAFFLSKTADLIQSKLRILLHLMEEEDIEAAVKKIQADAARYERVRIWRRLDANDQDQQKGGGAYD